MDQSRPGKEARMGRASKRKWRRMVALSAAGLVAFALGRAVGQNPAPQATPGTTNPVQAHPQPAQGSPVSKSPEPNSEYGTRVLAYIYNNVAITREDLGEYLIQRYGPDKIELLVNKMIIDHACKEEGIQVTTAEVDASFKDDCRGLGVEPKDFVDQFLAARHKTELEWREDVIRPRLQLTKLCKARVKVEEQELREAFEAEYGEKVAVRVILFGPHTNQRTVLQVYDLVRKNEEEFDRQARTQENSALAARGGQVKPVGRHNASPDIEREAFQLKPGEVSSVIGTRDSAGNPSGCIIMKCDGRVPPIADASFEKKREELYKAVFDRKLQEMIKVVFSELRAKADPKLFMKPPVIKERDMLHDVQQTIKQTDNELNSLGQGKK
jgi:hypothetical protein